MAARNKLAGCLGCMGSMGCVGPIGTILMIMLVVVAVVAAFMALMSIGTLFGAGTALKNYYLAFAHNVKLERSTL